MNEFWRSPYWLPLLAKGNTRNEELTSATMCVTRRWLEHRLIGMYTSRLNPSTNSVSLNTVTTSSHHERRQRSAAIALRLRQSARDTVVPSADKLFFSASIVCTSPLLSLRFVFNLARLLKPIYYIDMLIYANYTGFLLLSLAFVTVCVCMHVCMYVCIMLDRVMQYDSERTNRVRVVDAIM